MTDERESSQQEGAPAERPQPLQARHRDYTRGVILRALTEVVSEQGAHNFSVQEVADRAGVSHRTVYRHFPTREALLGALTDWADEIQRQHRTRFVPQEMPDVIRQAYTFFDENVPLMRALVITYTTTGIQPKGREGRQRAFRHLVETQAPGASPEDVARAAAAIHALASSQSWLYLREQLGLSGEEAREAAAWAVAALLRDLKTRSGRSPEQGATGSRPATGPGEAAGGAGGAERTERTE